MSGLPQPTNPSVPLGGRYRIISELGSGGFGKTFLAEDLHLPEHPRCVVKQLHPQKTDEESLAIARRLFDREAKVLYQLGNHDQIPRLLAHFEDNEEFYLVQELIEGKPLSKELTTGVRWSEARVLILLEDILEVLSFVHQQQVIHRDIKPANLMRRRQDSKIVLIDFGAVKQVSTQPVDAGTNPTTMTISIGTKGYMPNEQLAGSPRFSSDIHAVGVIGIQALTGISPSKFHEDVRGEIDWHQEAKHASSQLKAILDTMTCYDFRDRYPTAVEALAALQSYAAGIRDSIPASDSDSHDEAQTLLANSNPSSSPSPNEITTAKEQLDPEVEKAKTKVWLPSTLREKPPRDAASEDSTDSLPNDSSEQVVDPPSAPTEQPTTPSPSSVRRLVIPVAVVSVLAAAGTAIVVTRTILIPQLQQAYQDSRLSEPISSSSPSPTPSPSAPPTAETLLEEANTLRTAGQYQEALKLYDEAIALNSDLVAAYWGRCDSFNQLQMPDEAIVACNDALDLDPNYAQALVGKGNALDLQQQPLQALWLYEDATQLNPELVDAWVNYGIALQGFGRSVEAIDALDKAIALDRNNVEAWAVKGEALWNLGRYDRAIASLDKALQLQSDYPQAKQLRQQIREQLGR